MITTRRRHAGFSLVEMMVALALGLVVTGALTMAFVNSSQGRRETDRASRQIENGRYAMQLLSDDLALAGYYAEFSPAFLTGTYAPASVPDACTDASSSANLATLRKAIALPVQAYDEGGGMTLCTAVLSDLRSATDVIVVRRVSTCIRGVGGCDGTVAGTPYFQAALCSGGTVGATELNSAAPSDFYALDTNAANLTKHMSDCTTAASIRRFRTHIYFVTNNDKSGDAIPTLKRAELGAGGFSVVPLVEGIETLQVEWGMDTSSPTDGAPDVFTTDPGAYTGAGTAGAVGNWSNVVAARLYIVARNTESTPGYSDGKTYYLGKNAAGNDNTFTPATADRAYKRHLYNAEVRLNNTAGRYLVP